MKFGGVLKKGSKNAIRDKLAVSDPGSEDSWDQLCKNPEESQSKVSALESPQTRTTACVTNVPSGKVFQDKKDGVKLTKSKDDAERVENHVGNKSTQSTCQSGGKRILPFTSTPFVQHKKAPSFEVSSILTEDIPEDISPADNFSTNLIVNRQNPVRPPDDPFDLLLDPGEKIAKQTTALPGIKPLKSVSNQADTTRQYAGGNLRGTKTFQGHWKKFVAAEETSWDSSKELTLRPTPKKNPESPKKVSRASMGAPATVSKLISPEKLAEKVISSTGNSQQFSNGCNFQNDENQHHIGEDKSTRKGMRKSQKTENLSSDSKFSCGKRTSEPKDLQHAEKRPQSTTVWGRQSNINEGLSSKIQLDTVKSNRYLKSPTKVNSKPPLDSVNPSKGVTCDEVRTGEQEVASHEVSEKQPLRKHDTKVKSITICSEKIQNSSVNPQNKIGKEPNCKQTDAKMEANTKGEGQAEAETLKNRKADDNLKQKNIQLKAPAGKTTEDCDGSNQGNVFKGAEESSLQKKKNPAHTVGGNGGDSVKMVCAQSNFAIQIGNHCLKQSSCFGFVLHGKQSETSIKDSQESKDKASKSCRYSQPHNVNSQVTDMAKMPNVDQPPLNQMSPKRQGELEHSATPARKADETESSSEEEQKLLRAQSKIMRENQTHLSRISKISKIPIVKALEGIPASPVKKNSYTAESSETQARKSTKSLVVNDQPAKADEQMANKPPAPTNQVGFDDERVQPGSSHPNTSKHNSFNHSGESSFDGAVFLSRNPTDLQETADLQEMSEEDFQLEIFSSSEEEVHRSKQYQRRATLGRRKDHAVNSGKAQKGQELTRSKQPTKVLSLSSKVKELRRRREAKIQEMLKQRKGGSSSSVSEFAGGSPVLKEQRAVENFGDAINSDANEEHSDLQSRNRKRIYQKRKQVEKLDNKNTQTIITAPAFKRIVKNPDFEREGSHSEEDAPKRTEVRSSNMKTNPSKTAETGEELLGTEDPVLCPTSEIDAILPEPKNGNKAKVRSRKMKTSRPSNALKTTATDEEPQSQEEPHLLPVSDVDVIEEELHLKEHSQLLKEKQSSEEDTSDSVSHTVKKTKNVKKAHVIELRKSPRIGRKAGRKVSHQTISDEMDAEGLRCSKRARKPPSMYWLGKRSQNDVAQESVQQSSKNFYDEQRKAKSQKRKFGKSGVFETRKKVKRTEISSNSTKNLHPLRSFPEENILVASTSQDLMCDVNEVQEAKCVWGCGVTGDLLALGIGAKYVQQKKSKSNQVFYVVEGEISYQSTQEEKALGAGSFFIVPQGEHFKIKNTGTSTGKLVVVGC